MRRREKHSLERKKTSKRKWKISDKNPLSFIQTVRNDHKSTTPNISAEFHDYIQKPLHQICSLGAAQSRISLEGCSEKTAVFENKRRCKVLISIHRAVGKYYFLKRLVLCLISNKRSSTRWKKTNGDIWVRLVSSSG